MQAGEEMLRTKPDGEGGFNENSYNASDEVNSIKWNTLDKFKMSTVNKSQHIFSSGEPLLSGLFFYINVIVIFNKNLADFLPKNVMVCVTARFYAVFSDSVKTVCITKL